MLKKYGEIEKIEIAKTPSSAYGSSCIAQYKNREAAVTAMYELEKSRYLNGATVPMTVKLYDEVYPETVKENGTNAVCASPIITVNGFDKKPEPILMQQLQPQMQSQPILLQQPMLSSMSSMPPYSVANDNKQQMSLAMSAAMSPTSMPQVQYYPTTAANTSAATTLPLIVPMIPPAPPGMMTSQPIVFVEYFTPDGHPYYYNTISRSTQWETPPANAVVVKPNYEPKNLPGYVQSIPSNTKTVVMPKFTVKKGPPGCNVFIYHLPHEWTEQDIYLHFSPFGNMVSARVIVDPMTKLPKGYGIILALH